MPSTALRLQLHSDPLPTRRALLDAAEEGA
jgi:hypothetical protein